MSKVCVRCGFSMKDDEEICPLCGLKTGEECDPLDVEPVIRDQCHEYTDTFTESQTFGEADNAHYIVPETETKDNAGGKRRKKPVKRICMLAAAMIIVIAAVSSLAAVKSRDSADYQIIDARELFVVYFDGLSGDGSVGVELNADPEIAVQQDVFIFYPYTSASKNTDGYSDYFSDDDQTLLSVYDKAKSAEEAREMRNALFKFSGSDQDSAYWEVSKSGGVSNGDIITVEISYDEDYLLEHNIKLINAGFDVTVDGLPEYGEIYAFPDDYGIEFEGSEGSGEIAVAGGGCFGDKVYLNYYVYPSDGVYNGDTVTVTAELDLYGTGYTFVNGENFDDGIYFEVPNTEETGFVKYLWGYDSLTVTKEYIVEGLITPVEADPFEDVTLIYDGAAPYLTVTGAEIDKSSEFRSCVTVYADPEEGRLYDIGDKVTVRLYVYPLFYEKGFRYSGETDEDGYFIKEFTVGGDAPVYVNETNAYAADISTDIYDAFAGEINNVRNELIGASAGSYFGYEDNYGAETIIEDIKNIEYIGSYIAVNNSYEPDSQDIDRSGANKLIRAYRITVTLCGDGGIYSNTLYVCISEYNVIYENGSYSFDDTAEISVSTDFSEESPTHSSPQYTLTKITDDMTGDQD